MTAQHGSPQPAGHVGCRFQALRDIASTKWQQQLPFSLLVETTGLALFTLQRLLLDIADVYDLKTIARLCWLFEAQPGELLVYWQGAEMPPARPAMVRRARLPGRPIASDIGTLQLNLAPYAEQHWHALRALGAPASTLSTLKARGATLQRIHRRTLAYFCALGIGIDQVFSNL